MQFDYSNRLFMRSELRIYKLLFVLFFINNGLLFSQIEGISIQYYFSTGDYVLNHLSEESVIADVKSVGQEYIWVKTILNTETGKKSKSGNRAWAIKYNDHTYFNLLYSYYTKAPGLFIKLDVEGRYCLAIMDPNFLSTLNKVQPYNGVGLSDVLIRDSGSWAGSYYDKDKHKKKIFFIDTKNLTISIPYKANNAAGDLLTKDDLRQIIGKENLEKKAWEYSVEEIVELFKHYNMRYSSN